MKRGPLSSLLTGVRDSVSGGSEQTQQDLPAMHDGWSGQRGGSEWVVCVGVTCREPL